MSRYGVSLEAITQLSDHLKEVPKRTLRPGDWVFAKTVNSIYRIRVLDDGYYEVSGGWFERRGIPATKLRIHGCTWGSRVIKSDIVAACGMSIEFSNRLITSMIETVVLIPGCRTS